MSNSRNEVYQAIDTERDYQDRMAGNSARGNIEDNRDQGSLLLLMDHYLGLAKQAHAGPNSLGSSKVSDQARKAVALGVMLMERIGVSKRVG